MGSRHLILGLAVSALLPPTAVAQPSSAEPVAAQDAEAAVAAARTVIKARYVLPDVAQKLDEALARAAAAGAFRGLTGDSLAAHVTSVMNAVTPDAHLRMLYQPQVAALLPPSEARDTPAGAAWDEALGAQLRRTNAGVRQLELLPGNIRYLAYDSFGWGAPVAEQAIATAMAFLREGDAIIIDLRNNPGGSAYAEAAVASYFLPPGTKLARFEIRGETGETTETSAVPFSLAGKPTYVLIGPGTLSAGEVFATHVASFGFGTLVGSTTGGAGYTIRTLPLPGGYTLNVSVGRTVDAETGADWERVGVVPAIEAPANEALAVARAEAMEAVLGALPEAERARGERLLAFYRAQADPVAAALPLPAYAGRFGPFTVAAEDARLTMRFGELASETLVPLAADLFAAESDPGTQVRFVSQGDAVTALELDSGNGPPMRIEREPGEAPG